MKRIYLLMIALVAVAGTSFAQGTKNLNLRVQTVYGETEPTREILNSGDTVFVNAVTKYNWGWRVINDGPDSTEYGDTVRIISGVSTSGSFLANPFSLIVEYRQGGGGQAALPNLKSQDTGFYVPTNPAVAFSARDPHSSITQSNVNTAQLWCDTVWCATGTGNKTVNEIDPSDNLNCETITAIFWLVGVDGVPQPSTEVFMLFPNPATNQIHLKHTFDATQDATIKIVDITGRTVYTQDLGKINGTQDVPVNLPTTLAKGMYIMQLSEGEKVMSKRFSVN